MLSCVSSNGIANHYHCLIEGFLACLIGIRKIKICMFKYAKDYMDKELLNLAQQCYGMIWWLWYQAALEVVGQEKAGEIAEKCGELTGKATKEMILSLHGKTALNVEEMAAAADVMHAVMGYKAPWKMESKSRGYEEVTSCVLWNARPQSHSKSNICKRWCNKAGEVVYPELNPSRPKIIREKYIPDGDSCCKIEVIM
jgi:hypothetical protein